jgi:Zn-dependent M28 family amino/carboxypeptidase
MLCIKPPWFARSLALCGCVLLSLLFAACPKNQTLPINPRVGVSTGTPAPTVAPLPVAFNGERAMDHVRKQIEIGPRPPDSPALEKTRNYIISELKKYGLKVSTDEFVAKTPYGDKRMANIVAEITGETNNLILLASHYDTKLFDDMHFVGANDPGASVGTLIELGRVLASAKEKPKVTYRLIFFDGEEALCEGWSECGKPDEPDNTYGSRHYLSVLRAQGELERTRALILLDMMGYKNLELGRDTMSTKWLQDIIWQTGRSLGHNKVFVDREEGVGGDDHEPFVKAGIDSVDLIQLNGYPYWHRADDTIDKVSAESMKIVGDTVLASLPRIVAYVMANGG